MARSYLFVMWAGGGNVGPFLCLAEHLRAAGHSVRAVATAGLGPRLAGAGVDLVGTPEGWLPGAADVVRAAGEHPPDVVIVDYMLTDALGGAELVGRPTVALVHTLYRALLADGGPHPMGMAGPVDTLNPGRVAAGLAPLASLGDLLESVDLVLVAAPRSLDAPGEVPANVVYGGPLLEGPGPDAGWDPPTGTGPLVVLSLGTAGDPADEVPVLRRVVAALADLPVRGLVTLPDYVDRAALGAVPGNVTLSGYVRHAAVLPHADLLVTHAGLGSVVAALAHGVPMVALPLDREQPDNADALVRAGAGVALAPDSPAGEIRDAVADQLRRSTSPRVTVDPSRRRPPDRVLSHRRRAHHPVGTSPPTRPEPTSRSCHGSSVVAARKPGLRQCGHPGVVAQAGTGIGGRGEGHAQAGGHVVGVEDQLQGAGRTKSTGPRTSRRGRRQITARASGGAARTTADRTRATAARPSTRSAGRAEGPIVSSPQPQSG